MALWDRVSQFLALQPVQEPPLSVRALAEGTLTDLAQRAFGITSSPWRTPTIREAMSVPAIFRSVALISNTVGALSMEAYRNGSKLDPDDRPRIIVRPDPRDRPREFYRDTTYNIATRGEAWWWTAVRDSDGVAMSLVNVPPHEITVEEDPRDLRFPIIRWRDRRMRNADMTQITFLREPGELRGKGPLQMCGAAVSVAVEAQTWAANFYAEGGYPRDVIKHAGELDPTKRDEFGNPDPDGLSEADQLKAQYVARDNNTPIVIDQRIEGITHGSVEGSGAQMLESRTHQIGEAVRMFGMTPTLLAWSTPGASLTYQNVGDDLDRFTRTTLLPDYLEPIEQAISDLLTRSTVARFNVDGLLRADIKTRYEVHGLAIDKGIYDAAYAQRLEGLSPGDVERAPMPMSPPQALPASLPIESRSEMRDVRCPQCQRLIVRAAGPVEGYCRHCKAAVAA